MGRRISEVAPGPPREIVYRGKAAVHGRVYQAIIWEHPNGQRDTEIKDESIYSVGYYPAPGRVAAYYPPVDAVCPDCGQADHAAYAEDWRKVGDDWLCGDCHTIKGGQAVRKRPKRSTAGAQQLSFPNV